MSESTIDRLEREFGATCRAEDGGVTIECFDADSETVYALMAALDSAGQELHEVESIDPDLEEVFLQMIDEETGGEH